MNEQQIEGLPLGTRAVRVRVDGTNGGLLNRCTRDAIVDIVADNVYGKIDLSLVPIPEGWERLPEDWYRLPILGDQFLSQEGGWVYTRVSSDPSLSPRIIVRKKAPANAYGKDIDSIAIPEGWDKVGFREPEVGEYFLAAPNATLVYTRAIEDEFGAQKDFHRIIVKRKKKRYVVAKTELRDGNSLEKSWIDVPILTRSGRGSSTVSLSIVEE